MKQFDKELLLKDLSARLPYGVYCKIDGIEEPKKLTGIEVDEKNGHLLNFGIDETSQLLIQVYLSEVRPYLRPMESMSDAEKLECENYDFYDAHDGDLYNELNGEYQQIWIGPGGDEFNVDKFIDYLISHHLDFRGLISKNLAIEAKEGMYKFE